MAAPVVLLVEDDPDDEQLTLRSLAEARLASEVVVVRDGPAALKLSGLEVLERARKERAFDAVPIVIFTSSSHEHNQVPER